VAKGDEILLQGRGISPDSVEVIWGGVYVTGLRSVKFSETQSKENVGNDSTTRARVSGKKEYTLSFEIDGYAFFELSQDLWAGRLSVLDVAPLPVIVNIKKSVEGDSFGGFPVAVREEGLWRSRTFLDCEVSESSEVNLDKAGTDGFPVTLTMIVGSVA